jgi:aspartate ammonia-lyase
MRRAKATEGNKKRMIQALEKSLGIVTTAAKLIGIERTTHYLWMNTDPVYKQQVEEINDIALDLSESKLHSQIMKENIVAIIFHLKTKGKGRGYVERTEIKHETGVESSIIEWTPAKIENE